MWGGQLGPERKVQVGDLGPRAPGHLEGLSWSCGLDFSQLSPHEVPLSSPSCPSRPLPLQFWWEGQTRSQSRGSAPGTCVTRYLVSLNLICLIRRMRMPSLSSRIHAEAECGVPSMEPSAVAAFQGLFRFLPFGRSFQATLAHSRCFHFSPKVLSLIVYPQLWHPS